MPSGVFRLRRLFILAALCAGPFVASGGCASAQPRINFKRITVNWPDIELNFYTGCNGDLVYPSDKSLFRVFENGIEVRDFDFYPSNPYIHHACSVALVLDASASMAGAGLFDIKSTAHSFIDLLDSVVDEAAVISFAETSNELVGMIPDKDLMHRKVQELSAAGLSQVWDAAYDGLIELINNGVNPGRGVILMTDGFDNGSLYTLNQVISLANRNRIRIFALGIGNTLAQDTLRKLTDLTGGSFYPSHTQKMIENLYWVLTTVDFGEDWGHLIYYRSGCPDGNTRKVELTVRDLCGGMDMKSRTYNAPLDSTARMPLNVGISEASTGPLSDVTLALQLLDSNVVGTLGRARVHVRFDTSLLGFKDIAMPAATLLDAVPDRKSVV